MYWMTLCCVQDEPNYWTEGNYDDWLSEMAGGRLILERFANITDGSIIGERINIIEERLTYNF